MKHRSVNFRRSVLSAVILFVLVVQTLTSVVSGPATLQSSPKVSIVPSSLTGPPGWISINAKFTVKVNVSLVSDLFYWQVGLVFNPTVLRGINFTEGPFLKAGGSTVWQPGNIDNNEGVITPYGAALTGGAGVSGNGTLAYITFEVKDTGASPLLLEDVLLLDSGGRNIRPVLLQSGRFELPSAILKPPNAYFYYYPLAPYVNQIVTFNASETTSTGSPIVFYDWNFDDGSQGQGEIVSHTYTTPGEYNVTLTVVDNNGFVDSFSKRVVVFSLFPGTSIDAYTQRDGRGPGALSDSFAPQEMVVISSFLTRNGIAQAAQIVTFKVYYPDGTLALSRVSETDTQGVAYIVYRIPSTPVLVLYRVNASATVGGEAASDILDFRVGWFVEIRQLTPSDNNGVPKSEFRKGETLYLSVELQNIRFNPADVTLTATVRDELNQLIISSTSKYVISPGLTTLLWNVGSIPSWAYVGNATAYVSALQWLNGPSYSPDVSAWFMIVYSFPDVAIISVTKSLSQAYVGQSVTITVSVLNDHFEPHSFDVFVFANSTVIKTFALFNLPPYTQRDLSFIWDTYTVSQGNYTISAQASIIPGEIDTVDNTFVDGDVRIVPRTGPVHDIMVTDLKPSKDVVGLGFSLFINVTVQNQGDYTETFNVIVYANETPIASFLNIVLTSGASTLLTSMWDTTGFSMASYSLKANTTLVPDEFDIADNTNVFGIIIVAMQCDIAGSTTTPPAPPDGRVDYKDVFWLLKAYGSDPSKPNWNPNVDFAGSTTSPPEPPDNKVDYIDVFWLLRNYGRTSP